MRFARTVVFVGFIRIVILKIIIKRLEVGGWKLEVGSLKLDVRCRMSEL